MKHKIKFSAFLITTALLLSIFLPIHAMAIPQASANKENESPRSRDYGVSSADYGNSAAELRGIRLNEINLNGEIIINGELIDAPTPYVHKDDPEVVMVPLRAVAEKLGLKVIWQAYEQEIILGYGIQLWIGNAEFVTNFTFRSKLNPAPELTDGMTYVSLDFIRNVLEYDANISDGSVVIGESTSSTVWVSQDTNVAWFSQDSPNEYSGDFETTCVGKSPDGGDVFALLRMNLRGDWLAKEVSGARLMLKIAEGTPPDKIKIGTVAKSWSPASIERSMVKTVIREDSFITTELKHEENGWISIDVTDIVKKWLSGEIANRGFALFPENDQRLGVFVSGTSGGSADLTDSPRIIISGAVGERSTSYGKFGFTKQPVQGFADPVVGGNCLSYALRDTDQITHEDLSYTMDEVNRIFFESGENAVLEYVAGAVEEYIEAHKDGLQISNFRRIDSFDSPIDAEKEYRIIFRVSADATPEYPMTEDDGFDYHLWAQLSDGRWTQKSPSVFSSIIPGAVPGVSPLKYYWDAGDMWGIERWQEWYKSDGIYWAATKDTDEFTAHKH